MKMKRKSAKASTKPCNQMIWSVHFNNSLNNALRIWYIFNRIIEVHALNHLTLSSNVNTGEATTVQKSKFLENKFLWSIWLKRHLPYIIVIVLLIPSPSGHSHLSCMSHHAKRAWWGHQSTALNVRYKVYLISVQAHRRRWAFEVYFKN